MRNILFVALVILGGAPFAMAQTATDYCGDQYTHEANSVCRSFSAVECPGGKDYVCWDGYPNRSCGSWTVYDSNTGYICGSCSTCLSGGTSGGSGGGGGGTSACLYDGGYCSPDCESCTALY